MVAYKSFCKSLTIKHLRGGPAQVVDYQHLTRWLPRLLAVTFASPEESCAARNSLRSSRLQPTERGLCSVVRLDIV